MIELLLIRKTKGEHFTHGELFIKSSDGSKWLDFCHTLEDKVRDYNMDGDLDDEGETKIYGETAIPFGEYKGKIRFSPSKNRYVPWIDNVKHFKYIQIHSGTTENDSLGCVLVGYKTDNNGKIWESKKAESDLTKIIQENGWNFKLKII